MLLISFSALIDNSDMRNWGKQGTFTFWDSLQLAPELRTKSDQLLYVYTALQFHNNVTAFKI